MTPPSKHKDLILKLSQGNIISLNNIFRQVDVLSFKVDHHAREWVWLQRLLEAYYYEHEVIPLQSLEVIRDVELRLQASCDSFQDVIDLDLLESRYWVVYEWRDEVG